MAKRVNKKFLIILTICVMGPVLAIFFMAVFLKNKNAAQYIESADAHYAKREYEEALSDYMKAFSRSQDVSLLIKQGDCQSELCRTDPDRVYKFRQPWEKALELDPRNVQALKRLYESTKELTELSPAAWEQFKGYAEKYFRADPTQKSVEVMLRVADVNIWLKGGKAVTELEIKSRLDALEKLMEANPSERIIPETIAASRIRMARDNALSKNTLSMAEHAAKAKDIVDKAVEAQPENAGILYVRAMIYSQLTGFESNVDRIKELSAISNESLEKAASLTKKDDEDYVGIRLSWAQKLISEGKRDEAKVALTEVVQQRPESADAIISMAKLLRADSKTRPEAIKLLGQKMPDDDKIKGFQVQKRLYGDLERLSLMTMIQIDTWSATEAADKPALKQLINDNIARLKKANKNNPLVLKAEGAALLMDGQERDYMAGVGVLESAVEQLDTMKAYDTDLYFRLANAYLRMPETRDRQTGQAEKMLQRILEIQPGDVYSRQLLIKVLNDERKYDQALKHINFFIDNKADVSGLISDRIVALIGVGSLDKARDLVNALPETTFAERLNKARLATLAKMTVVADNLMRRLAQEELLLGSEEYPGTFLLIQSLVRDRKREEAKTVVQTALQKTPDNKRLNLIAKLLEGETDPEKLIESISGDGGVAMQDEEAAIQKAILYANQGDVEKALATVVASEKTHPDSVRLAASIFGYQLDLKKFDEAEQTLKKLQKFDADRVEGLSFRVQLKVARQDYEGALKDAIDLTKKQDTFAASWVLKGMAQQGLAARQRLEDDRKSSLEAAIVSYNKALECQADNFQALKGLIDCHMALNQDSQAREVIRKGMQGKEAAYFLEQSRRIDERKGDPRTVTSVREKAVQDNPDSASARMSLIDNYAAVASYLRNKNDQAGYENMANQVLKNLEDAVKKWPEDINFAGRLAQTYALQKKFPQAIAVLTALSEKDAWKDKPQPRAMLAQFELASGNRTQAEDYYIQATKLSGDSLSYKQTLLSFYFQNDMATKGLDLLKSMVEQTQSTELRIRYVTQLIANNQSDKAEEVCRQTLAKDPTDLDAKCLMAFIRMSAGSYSESERLLEEVLKVNPRFSRALYYRGALKHYNNDIAGAVADLTSARMSAPENPDIRMSLSDALIQRGETNGAAAELEDAIRYAPSRSDARQKLVNIYFSQERWNDLNRVLEEGIKSGDSTDDSLWLKYQAKMWIARKDFKNATDSIQAALELAPTDPEVNYIYLDVALMKGRHADVIEATDKVIQEPGSKPWWIYMLRGKAFAALKKDAEAKTAFEMAMTQVDGLSSSDVAEQLTREMAAFDLAWTHQQLSIRKAPYWQLCDMRQYIASGDVESGIRIADKFTDDMMRDFTEDMKIKSRIYIGETLTLAASAGNERAFNRAIEVYNTVLKNNDRLSTLIRLQVLNNLAFLYSDGSWKNYEKGLGYSQQAYDLMTKVNYVNPTIADTHAWLLVLNNQLAKGIAMLQGVIEKDSSFPDAHYHLAEAYYRNKQYSNARDSIARAKETFDKIISAGGVVDASLEAKIKEAKSRIDQAQASNNPGNPG